MKVFQIIAGVRAHRRRRLFREPPDLVPRAPLARLQSTIGFHVGISRVRARKYKTSRSVAEVKRRTDENGRVATPLVPCARMDLLWRFLLGGAIVSLFAFVGDVVRPKRFAGIFGGAPSVALATLALTADKSGALTASLEARSMILSSVGFVLYVYVALRLLATARWPPLLVALGGLGIWALVAAGAGLLLQAWP